MRICVDMYEIGWLVLVPCSLSPCGLVLYAKKWKKLPLAGGPHICYHLTIHSIDDRLAALAVTTQAHTHIYAFIYYVYTYVTVWIDICVLAEFCIGSLSSWLFSENDFTSMLLSTRTCSYSICEHLTNTTTPPDIYIHAYLCIMFMWWWVHVNSLIFFFCQTFAQVAFTQ